MTKINIWVGLLIVPILLLMNSCKQDQPTATVHVQDLNLEGTWKMHEAYKGNAQTKLLDNAYFTFTKDAKVSTNVLGDETPYAYTLKNGKLVIGSGSNSFYNVELVTTDTLILTTRMRNFNFKFITVKSPNE